MSYNEPPLSAGRRVYNIGSHGGSFAAHGSLNQRLLDGIDLNESGRRYDNNFDTSHDNLGDHNSSRLNYSTGGGGLAEVVSSTLGALKRSETEQNRINSQVTFAETAGIARNHPLHMKSSTGQMLERIEEGKSNSPSRRYGASANTLNR